MSKEVQYAEQGQNGLGGLALPVLVIGGLLLFNRMRSGGNGGGGGISNGGDVPAGMASVGGGISGVEVSQAAGMGQVDKTVGASLSVVVRFEGNTTRNGARISWPYYAIVRIGHNTVFGFRTATQLNQHFLDRQGNRVDFPWPSQQQNTSGIGVFSLPTMTIPNDPGVTWDINVQLRAQGSDANGDPDGVWQDVGAELKERGAFEISSPTITSSIDGSVTRVTVTQPLPGEVPPMPAAPIRRGLRLSRRR